MYAPFEPDALLASKFEFAGVLGGVKGAPEVPSSAPQPHNPRQATMMRAARNAAMRETKVLAEGTSIGQV